MSTLSNYFGTYSAFLNPREQLIRGGARYDNRPQISKAEIGYSVLSLIPMALHGQGAGSIVVLCDGPSQHSYVFQHFIRVLQDLAMDFELHTVEGEDFQFEELAKGPWDAMVLVGGKLVQEIGTKLLMATGNDPRLVPIFSAPSLDGIPYAPPVAQYWDMGLVQARSRWWFYGQLLRTLVLVLEALAVAPQYSDLISPLKGLFDLPPGPEHDRFLTGQILHYQRTVLDLPGHNLVGGPLIDMVSQLSGRGILNDREQASMILMVLSVAHPQLALELSQWVETLPLPINDSQLEDSAQELYERHGSIAPLDLDSVEDWQFIIYKIRAGRI